MDTYNCKQIEELILKQTTETLTQGEFKIIETHIANCLSCKTLTSTLSKMEASMEFQSNKSLQPKPSIRENVIKKMAEKSRSKKQWYFNFINPIRSILEYRLPVYQAGLAMLIIFFLLIYGFDFSKTLIDKTDSNQIIAENVEYPYNNQYMIDNHPNLENQKVGMNAREDSILIKFIYTSM